MDNNTVDPSTLPRTAPKSARAEGLTSDYLTRLEKAQKPDPADKLRSDIQVTDANALMADKRLVASNNLEMIRDRLKEISESLNPGDFVKAPFGTSEITGVVWSHEQKTRKKFKIRKGFNSRKRLF